MLNRIFLAHSDSFVEKILTKFLKEDLVETYVIDPRDYNDFKYLLKDLGPDLILLEEKVFHKHLEAFTEHFKEYPLIPKGLIVESDVDFAGWDVVIRQPLAPEELSSMIKEQLPKI